MVAGLPGSAQGGFSSVPPRRSLVGLRGRDHHRHGRLGGPRLAVDHRPGRPDHQRHDHQHRGPGHHRLPDRHHQPDLAAVGRQASRPSSPPSRLTDLPIVGWLFNMFLNQGPDHDVGHRPRRSSCRSCSSARAGACAPAPVGEHPRAAETVGHRRHPAALPQRHPGRHLRRPRGRLVHARLRQRRSRTA